MTKPTYLTLQSIWHTGEGRQIGPGEVVGLDHLSERVQRNLILQGVIADIGGLLSLSEMDLEKARILAVFGAASLEVLTGQDADALAEKTGFSPKQIATWQKEAGKLLKQAAEVPAAQSSPTRPQAKEK